MADRPRDPMPEPPAAVDLEVRDLVLGHGPLAVARAVAIAVGWRPTRGMAGPFGTGLWTHDFLGWGQTLGGAIDVTTDQYREHRR